MASSAPTPHGTRATPAVPPRALPGAWIVLVLLAFLGGRAWLDELASFGLVSLFLWPSLRRGQVLAWAGWAALGAFLLLLGLRGQGALGLAVLPVLVNAALCVVFARTLARGREPLVARVIGVLEGPARLAMPRVAGYARALTLAWALLLGAQALVLALLLACLVPDGLLASFGVAPVPAVTGAAARGYLFAGSYVVVLAFLALEYAFRRWYLRALPHDTLPRFVARLARCWPALLRSLADEPR
jgi:uncharacterized membrane protein